MRWRAAVFWLHLAAGVLGGIVILTMSVTGLLLVSQRPVTSWAERDYRIAPAGRTRLSVESLLRTAPPAVADAPLSSVTFSADPEAPAMLGFGRERLLFLDPYTGATLGHGAERTRAFFRFVEGVHRRLGTQGEGREWGEAVTGAATLLFVGLIATGLCLWWPRRWSRDAVRQGLRLEGGLVGRVRRLNQHQVIGFWSALPLLLVAGTGVVMAYPWATALVYRLADGHAPAPSAAPATPDVQRRPRTGAIDVTGLDAVSARAVRDFPDWRILTLRIPAGRGPVTAVVDRGNGGRPDLRTQLVLDRASADVVRAEPFAGYSLGRRLRTWARWVHTGEAGGPAGQALAAAVSLNATLLVLSGLSLAWQRLRAWWPRRRAREHALPAMKSSLGTSAATSGSSALLEEVR